MIAPLVNPATIINYCIFERENRLKQENLSIENIGGGLQSVSFPVYNWLPSFLSSTVEETFNKYKQCKETSLFYQDTFVFNTGYKNGKLVLTKLLNISNISCEEEIKEIVNSITMKCLK